MAISGDAMAGVGAPAGAGECEAWAGRGGRFEGLSMAMS